MRLDGNNLISSRKHFRSTSISNSLAFGIQFSIFCLASLTNQLSRVSRDTVSSVGLIPRRLPFTTSNTIVCTFRHAISLDERRAKFKANLWNRPNATELNLSISDQAPKKPAKKNSHSKQGSLHAMERKYSKDRNQPTDIDEV